MRQNGIIKKRKLEIVLFQKNCYKNIQKTAKAYIENKKKARSYFSGPLLCI